MIINKRASAIIIIFLSIALSIILFSFRHSNTHHGTNVILITVDALRPDHLGCYGYKRDTSPNIDKLAKEGVLFSQAICQGSWTGTSLTSLITSDYPHSTGVSDWGNCLNSSLPTLATLLKKCGYYTEVVNGHTASDSLLEMGVDRGFDNYNNGKGGIRADEITRRAINSLYQQKNRKFFLWLHYFDTHAPYKLASPYSNRYINDNLYRTNKHIPISDDSENPWFSRGKIPYFVQDRGIKEVDYYIAQYDSEIRFVDEQIGILLRTLEELGLNKNTMIIITADHGEGMGEHNAYFTHGFCLYDEFIKVPLIIKYADVFPPGRIFKSQVGLIDVMPTVLGLLSIKTGIHMEGINLLPFISGRRNYPLDRALFTELPGSKDNLFNMLIISMRLDKWKLIYFPGRQINMLYNLATDPDEQINLADIEKEQFGFMKNKLESWLKQQKVNRTILVKPFNDDVRKRLKSIGYLN